MKKLLISLMTLTLMGSLQAMSPTIEEAELLQERLSEKKKEWQESKKFLKYVISELGLEEHALSELDLKQTDSADANLTTLLALKRLGMTKEEVVSLIEGWRALGHAFPDERFDSYSVANAILKYAQKQGYNVRPSALLTPEEEHYYDEGPYKLGNKLYAQSDIYAMTPDERGQFVIDLVKKRTSSKADRNLVEKLTKEWDADVNATDNDGATALIWAARLNNLDMGLFLIAAGADLNVDAEFPLKRSGLPGGTALKQAFAHSPEMAQALIDAGADLNGQDRYGHTLLTDAALHGNIERIELLINAGADVNAAGRGGYTALMAAAAEHHLFAAEPRLDIVELLLQAGADVNAINDNCRTALDQALERPRGAEETASLLRQHGATTGYQLSTACVIQ